METLNRSTCVTNIFMVSPVLIERPSRPALFGGHKWPVLLDLSLGGAFLLSSGRGPPNVSQIFYPGGGVAMNCQAGGQKLMQIGSGNFRPRARTC